MTYKDKVKASKEIIKRMQGLSEDDTFTFKYNNETYRLKCYAIYDDGRKSYAIDKIAPYMGGMNIDDKIGPTTLTLYTYDIMQQRSTYKLPMYQMEVITPIEA